MLMIKFSVSEAVLRQGKVFKDDYSVHKAVYAIVDKDKRPLFHYEYKQGCLEGLIYSDAEPQALPGVAVQAKEMHFPKNGNAVFFQLTANVVIQKSGSNRIEPHPDPVAWLEAKKIGLEFGAIEFEHAGVRRISNSFGVIMTRLYGRGIVTDEASLEKAIRSGVGRAKAWGCGMLLVQKLNQ
jgi:hypothetical protein